MKKKLFTGLLALTILVGVAGTLSYARSTYLEAKEDAITVGEGPQIAVLQGGTALDDAGKGVTVTASSFSTEQAGDQLVTLPAKEGAQNEAAVATVHVKPVPEPAAPTVVANEAEPVATVDPNHQGATEPVAAAPEPATTVGVEPPVEVPPVAQAEPTWSANTMYVGGLEILYQNAGQSRGQGVIDSNSNVIATWGGNAVQSGSDGANTHFIGHNPGIFSVLFSLGDGSQIIVTDGAGIPTSYTVNQILQVDDYATGVADGQSYVDQIVGSGGGERITLQTCVTEDINLIVMASAA